jgi:hypothetical protein
MLRTTTTAATNRDEACKAHNQLTVAVQDSEQVK